MRNICIYFKLMLHIVRQTYPTVIQTLNFEIVQSDRYRITLNKMTKILVAITKKTKNTIKRENEWKTGFTLET